MYLKHRNQESLYIAQRKTMQVLQYCAPLFAVTPASSFLFMRILPQKKKVILLSTHGVWLQSIYNNKSFLSSNMLQDVLPKISSLSFYAQLWSGLDKAWRGVKCDTGLQGGVNLWKRCDAGITLWSFGFFSKGNHLDATVSAIDEFKLFADHFEQRASSMIRLMEDYAYRFEESDCWLFDKDDQFRQFVNLTPIRYFPVIVDGKKQNITYKQALCLQGLYEGKKTKILAQELGVSCRTVEKHIENLKASLNMRCRKKMLSVYKESRGFWL